MRVLIITNMPAPYRIAAWNIMAEKMGDNFRVLFCCKKEPNRHWTVPEIKFRHDYLKENFRIKNNGNTYVHKNPDVWKHLVAFQPDVIVTGGFNPTMLYAFAYTLLKGKKHVPISDAWKLSEQGISVVHKIVRRVLYSFSQAYIACSVKGKEYYQSFGLNDKAIFISHYTVNLPDPSSYKVLEERRYDLVFSGQFTERKNPFFFIQICKLLKEMKPDLKVLLLGGGPLSQQMLHELSQQGIDFDYPGYVAQERLPEYYSKSKLFLFPTESDAWGVVANEALSAGTPLLVTPFAGCSNELVINEYNGFVLTLETSLWAEHCMMLLQDKQKWKYFSENAQRSASQFTHQRAANALFEACKYAYQC